MKIALLSVFYPYRGGIAQFGAMLYRALEPDNEVKAFNFKRQYPNFLFPGTSQFVGEDDTADPIPSARVLDSIGPLSFSKTARKINAFHPDLIISQYWMTFFGPSLGSVSKRSKGTRRIAILHNVIPHEKRFFDAAANRYFLKHNDGFIVMSDVVLRDLLSLKPDAKYLRIDHPVYSQFGDRLTEIDARTKLGVPLGKKVLLFFGIIRDYKGLDVLLKACSLLPDDYHLLIAGESYGSFEKYDQQIKELKLEARVTLCTRYIEDREVSAFFSAADVCVLPYRSATQSGITAIAHHFNLPLIATDVGGLKETIFDGKTGLIVAKPEPELLASTIMHYFEDNMKVSLSTFIEAQKIDHSWENFARKIIEFAKSIDVK